jgi:hypothetical protein
MSMRNDFKFILNPVFLTKIGVNFTSVLDFARIWCWIYERELKGVLDNIMEPVGKEKQDLDLANFADKRISISVYHYSAPWFS